MVSWDFVKLGTEACCMLRSASCRSMARCSCLRSDWVCSLFLVFYRPTHVSVALCGDGLVPASLHSHVKS